MAPGELLENTPPLWSISPSALQGLSPKAGVTPFQPLSFHPSCTPKKLHLASEFTTCPPNLTEKDSSAHISGSLLNQGLVEFYCCLQWLFFLLLLFVCVFSLVGLVGLPLVLVGFIFGFGFSFLF